MNRDAPLAVTARNDDAEAVDVAAEPTNERARTDSVVHDHSSARARCGLTQTSALLTRL